MTRSLALLRPEPGWSVSAKAARTLGLTVIGHPVFVAEPVKWTVPAGAFDALLVGSAKVFTLGGAGLTQLAHLPVHAVGEATAQAARAAGFTVARKGEGGLQRVLDAGADEARRYLRVGGEERVTLHPHEGQRLTEVIAYRMRPLPLAPALATALALERPLVALHSAAAARHFLSEIQRLGLGLAKLSALALGPRIASAAGAGWAAIHIAETPDDAALLAKAAALCK